MTCINFRRAAFLLLFVAVLNVRAQPVLSLDVNTRTGDTSTNTQSGFSTFTMAVGTTGVQMGPATQTYGAIAITLSNSSDAFGYDDRVRATPAPGGALTLTNIYRDFIFSRDNSGTSGLDIAVAGLNPNGFYRFTIWSFDSGSAGNRVSDWSANGNLVITGYAFNGAVLPTTDSRYSFSFVTAADDGGQVLVSGRRTPASVDQNNAASFGVFFNGMQIVETDPRPVVLTHPAGSTNIVGDRVTFGATADGATPLSFQWFKGEVEVPDATTSSLTLSNLAAGDSGEYKLRVTNQFGTNISSAATLLVLPDAAPAVRQGLVSHWPVENEVEDDQGRPTLEDLYSHNDFKVVANTVFIDLVSGQFDLAIPFNGIEQYCYREGGFPAYKTSTNTVAMWVNANGIGQSDKRFFCESSTNNNSVFSLGTHATGASGAIRVLIANNSGVSVLDRLSTRTALDGSWHHVAWTERNGQGRLYIDGVLDETSFSYTRGAVTLDNTTIGAQLRASGATNFFTGALDEIATWSRALSFTEIDSIRTAGIPFPIQDQPPGITADPVSQSVLTRTKVTFDFAASGASPLFAQWRKNGTNLPGETNFTLRFNGVTLDDAGSFNVVVTNSLGSATSQVATLSVALRPTTTELKVDFNNLGADDVPANTEPGFSSFALPVSAGTGPFTRVYGGAEVTVSAIGGISMQSRKRLLPTNSAAFTEERLLQDFIFSPDSTAGQGLDIAIAYLEPNQTYTLTIWSFDNSNNGRFSDWSANGVTVTNGYTFTGSALPVDNSTYRFSYPVTANAEGTVLIQARRGTAAASANNVFLNAFQISPLGQLRVGKIALLPPSSLRLTFDALNPSATHHVEEKTNVGDANWTEVPGAVFGPPSGNTIEVTIPVPNTATRFYRVVETP